MFDRDLADTMRRPPQMQATIDALHAAVAAYVAEIERLLPDTPRRGRVVAHAREAALLAEALVTEPPAAPVAAVAPERVS